MIYTNIPENFNPVFESVGCFIEFNGKFILLHRQDDKPEGDTWGLPSGKIKEEEKPQETIVREIKEETGFDISVSQIKFFSKVYVKFPKYDFVYHIFHTKLSDEQKVKISSKEHKDFKWVNPQEALGMNFIQDLDGCIKLVYGI